MGVAAELDEHSPRHLAEGNKSACGSEQTAWARRLRLECAAMRGVPPSTQPARRQRAGLIVGAVLVSMFVWVTPAAARALLIAGSGAELLVAELSTDSVVSRIAMPAPVSAVAASRFGGKGYAAAQSTLIEIEIDTRTEIRRAVLPGAPISQLALTPDGRLLALQDDRVTIVDPASLTVLRTIALGATGRQLTAGRGASRAVVVLSGGRVAILALARIHRSAGLTRGLAVGGSVRVADRVGGGRRGRWRSLWRRCRRCEQRVAGVRRQR